MDMLMTENQVALRDAVRKFAEAELLPKYMHWDRSGEWVTREVIDKMVEMGLLRLRMPEHLGGQGLSFVDCGIVCEEIGRCDTQLRYPITSAVHISEMSRQMDPELRDEWLPRIAQGEIMALAFTEPGGGSDAANIRTKATRDGDHYVLNGEKTSISFTGVSSVMFVSARTGGPGPWGLSFFLVPADTPGIRWSNYERMGQRLTRAGSIFFDDVRIPARNMIGPENKGFVWAMTIIGYNRNFVALACIGAAQKSIEETAVYMKQREVMGQPVSKWQGAAHALATEQTKLQAARLLCYNALALVDKGQRHDPESSMAKWYGVKVANEAIETCMRLHGHYGWSKDFPFEQRLRDGLGMESADGPREVHLGIISRDLFGKDFAPF